MIARMGRVLGVRYLSLRVGLTEQGRKLAVMNPAAFVAVFVWPLVLGSCLVLYGISKPSGQLFGVDVLPAAFVTAGVVVAAESFTVSRVVRSVGLGAATLVLVGRVLTLTMLGDDELDRIDELAVAALLGTVWAAAVLVHFLATPDAGRLEVEARDG